MAQELVPDTQERFRMLVDTAPVMVWMAGPDTLRTFFNRPWLEFTGCTLAEELGTGWISSVHPDDRASCVDRYRHAFEAREQFTIEYRLRRADGAYRWLLDTGVPHWERGVFAGYLGSCVDISDRKEAEAALRDSEERFRVLFESSPDAVLLVDPHHPDGTWPIMAGNEAAAQMNGYSRTELIGRPLNDLHAVAREPQQLALFLQRLRDEDSVQGITVHRRKDGSLFPVEWSASLITVNGRQLILGVDRDITEHQNTEEALRKSEERFRLIVEGSDQVFFYVHDTEHRWTYLSPSVETVLGFAPGELLGHHYDELLTGDESDDRVNEQTATAIATGRRREPYVALLRHKAGYPLFVEITETPIVVDGKVMGIQGFARDISERKRAEEQLQEREQILEQRVAERTRELTTLLEVSRTVGSTLELKPLMALILEQLKAVVAHDGAAVFILDQSDELSLLHYSGPLQIEELALRWPLPQIDHVRAVIHGATPIIIDDVHAGTEAARSWRRTSVDHLGELPPEIATWMGVPLIFREQVIGMLSVDYNQARFYTQHHANLMLAFASHAAVAIENARLYEQAQGLAVLMERQRLARELHDSVSQALYGIALGARTARTLLDRDPSRLAEPLDYVLSLAEAGLTEMRALIFELRPESLETEGLAAALAKQAASIKVRHHIEVETELCPEPDLPFEIKEALFRIAQEALNNTIKHAQATTIRLRLACSPDGVTLEVCDNGGGFDPSGSFPGHLGQHTMRERATKQGGTLVVESAPGAGTCVRAHLPIACFPR